MSRYDEKPLARLQPEGGATRQVAPVRTDSGVRPKLPRTNLEPTSAPLVGRQGELDAVCALLQRERQVTLIGPPGIGKSQLARGCARRLLEDFSEGGGVWVIDLADATSVDSVCWAIARAMDVALSPAPPRPSGPPDSRQEPDEPTIAQLGAALGTRGRMLVVLDGAEHVAEATSRALETWKRAARDARWLVTSRTRLTTPGEVLFDLGPLSFHPHSADPTKPRISDAARLFTARADAELVSRDDLPIVAQIARTLDGNPLAIELVAAGSRGRAPREVLMEVMQLGEKLGGGARRLHPRQLAPRIGVAFAWAALEPWQAHALAQCSVFAGCFDVEAAEAVLRFALPPGYDIDRALDALRARGLLQAIPPTSQIPVLRYAMHALVREEAAERLVQYAERADTIARHASFFLGRARSDTPAFADADNLLAAQRRAGGALAVEAALALEPLLARTAPPGMRVTLLDDALAAGPPLALPAALRGGAVLARAWAYRDAGRLDESNADFEAASAIAQGELDAAAQTHALLGLAMLDRDRGDLAAMRRHLEEALANGEACADAGLAGRALAMLGELHLREGRRDLARTTLERARAMHAANGDAREEAAALLGLATLAQDEGDLAVARALADRALSRARAAGSDDHEAAALVRTAHVAYEEGRADEAKEALARAVQLDAAAARRGAEGRALGMQAALWTESRDFEEARIAYARALSLLRESGDREGEARVLCGLSTLESIEGAIESARAALGRAAESMAASGPPDAGAPLVDLTRGQLELALARDAKRSKDDARADIFVEAVRRRVASARAVPLRSADARLALRALEKGLDGFDRGEGLEPVRQTRASARPEALDLGLPADLPADALLVCARGRWFRPPHATPVPIDRWQALQNLVMKLAERREIAPGEALSVDDLIAAGWPGERILPKAGATRVYTALSTLRRLGMRDVLVRRGGGYMLEPDVPLMRVSAQSRR